jgi:EmrB/QacA subfamily drug resistance transporter
MSQAGTSEAQQLGPDRTMVLIVATLGGFLVTFMSSAINIALPMIEAEFGMSAVTLSWISLAYILVAGATLLPAGRLADMYGRVRLFIWGMIIFTVFAFASAFAPSAGILLALRAVHGLGLAIGAVTATALVILAYPVESRGKALGINVAGVYLGLTLGPVLGGLIVHNLGWRSLFLIVGALGLVNLVLPVWKLRHHDWREPKRAQFDTVGSALSAVSLFALMLGFSFLPQVPGIVLVVGGIAGIAAFVWWETRATDPLLDVGLFRHNRVFAFSNTATFINYSATAAMVFLMSLYLQYNRGLDAQMAGLVLVTGTFIQTVFSLVAGRLADRTEARYVAASGMAASAVGLFALSFLSTMTPYWYIVIMLCLIGAGLAFFSTPATHAVMGSVGIQSVGIASATLATMRQTGQSMSTGVATLVLAIEVGRQAIEPTDYPALLTSIKITFLIFAVLCVFGVAASLVGPRRSEASGS